jgi:phosphoenolpyruvate carboxykinase (ATP)
MPCLPNKYSDLLGKKMQEHQTVVYLVNTGWSGGPFGMGNRMDIMMTRAMVNAALDGKLQNVQFKKDPLFHLDVPVSCPGVPSEILFPENTWNDSSAYKERAKKLAREFSDYFDKAYGNKQIDPKVREQCPGK